MEQYIPYIFRSFFYILFGLTMETVCAMHSIDGILGYKVNRRVPKKYFEGFVSVYMIPLYAIGLLFGFEAVHALIKDFFILYRYIIWAILIGATEALWGFALHKIFGFYAWDYYKKSRYKVFKEGYTLWTLIPLWGIAGLILEVYSSLLIYLSPYVVEFFK